MICLSVSICSSFHLYEAVFYIRVLPIMGMGGRPFGLRVLPITGMGGRPFGLRVLPITRMGGHPGRCPFGLRVLPITSPGSCPFLIRVLPITSPVSCPFLISAFTSLGSCPLLVRVLPILSMGRFYSNFFVSKVILFVLGPFLTYTRHAGYLVKCSTNVSTSFHRKQNDYSLIPTRSDEMNS